MGWAKYDEDIRDIIDNRTKESGNNTYNNTHIHPYPNYTSKKTPSTVKTYYVNPSSTVSRYNATPMYSVSSREYRPSTTSTSAAGTTVSKPTPVKQKIGYVKRDFDHYGIEIYFYTRPIESILDELKNNGWHWHRQKKCWFRKYSTFNQCFAEKIIEK